MQVVGFFETPDCSLAQTKFKSTYAGENKIRGLAGWTLLPDFLCDFVADANGVFPGSTRIV